MKVSAVLQAFGAYEEPVSLTVLARHTELPKSTTHRMVFLRNLKITGGLAPARVIIPWLIDRVLDGRIDASPVFDLTVGLEAVPEAYRQMDNRTAIKALIRIS
ncbi:helix-turn-helix domain-containing protein [Saccharopolyspora hattusasensis]|uniref:helix-turn-helix domain-containing protein n=1 Tax=Saccharopolyspora hattusasensis TaxID=1128679 RepID=UPI003D9797D6